MTRHFRTLTLLAAALVSAQCAGPQSPRQETAHGVANTPAADADKTRAADAELARRVNEVLATDEAAAARWGIAVVSLRDGRMLYARDAERLFLPASSYKLYTTGTALDLLGADYRWRTSVYASAPPDARGTINGDLTLYGRGAPDL